MRRLLTLLPVLSFLLFTSVAAAQEAPVAPDAAGEAAMLDALNTMRAEAELAPLTRSPELDAAARAHSLEMASNGALAHVSETTGSPEDRVRATGLSTGAVAENVAMHRDAAQAQQALVASPPHHANMLSAELTHVGLGVVRTAEGVYATQLFTTIAAATPEPPPAAPIATPTEDTPPAFGIIPPFVESIAGQAAEVATPVLEAGPRAIEQTLGADEAAPDAPAAPAEAAPALQAPAAPAAPATTAPATGAPAAAPDAAATLRQLVGLAQSLLAPAPAN